MSRDILTRLTVADVLVVAFLGYFAVSLLADLTSSVFQWAWAKVTSGRPSDPLVAELVKGDWIEVTYQEDPDVTVVVTGPVTKVRSGGVWVGETWVPRREDLDDQALYGRLVQRVSARASVFLTDEVPA